jgi:hypothetical protein
MRASFHALFNILPGRDFGLAGDFGLAQPAAIPVKAVMRFDIIFGHRFEVIEAFDLVVAGFTEGFNRTA